MLLEAAKTSLENQKALEIILNAHSQARAAESAKRQARGSGRRVRYHSKAGVPDTLTFTDVDAFPEVINSHAPACKYAYGIWSCVFLQIVVCLGATVIVFPADRGMYTL